MIQDTVGIAEETTFGTVATPNKFHEYIEEGITAVEEDVRSNSVPGGRKLLGSTRRAQGRSAAEGPLKLEYVHKGMEYLWKHILGNQAAIVVAGVAGAKKATLGDLLGKGLTVQKGLRTVSGTIVPFTYSGGKVTSWEFGCDVDGFLELALDLDFLREDTTTAYATPNVAAGLTPFAWTGGAVTVAGSAVGVKSCRFRGDNALKTDRFLMGTTPRVKKEQTGSGRPKVEGELTIEFDGLTPHTRFKAGTLAAVNATWSSPLEVTAGNPYKVIADAALVRFTGSTPTSGGEDVTEYALPFEVLDDGGADGGFSVITHTD